MSQDHDAHVHDEEYFCSVCKVTTKEKHAHGGMAAMSHGSATMFLRRFWIVTVLLIPLLFTNEFVTGVLGVGLLPYNTFIGFGISTVIFGFSLIFFRHAWHEIRSKSYGMMTLVSIAVGSGYLFSVASTFVPSLEVAFYMEISTLIWVLLFGHYLEAKSTSAAGNALQEVAKLLPKKAHKVVDGVESEVAIADLQEGDVVVVKPGEKVPADGVVDAGVANVNESLISGESKPVQKEVGDTVVAGAICIDGALTIVLSRVGEHSTIGQIKKLISDAQSTKPHSQKVADKASAVLTFVAAVTALLTILIWSVFLGQPFVFAITLAITVLVIACPHALGLAIPTVTTISTSLAVKNGVFIKDLSKIEVIRKADYVVFDKTGTLTKGEFGVSNIHTTTDDYTPDEILAIAASLEQQSSHIIGQSIVAHAQHSEVDMKNPEAFKNIAGKGVSGMLAGASYYVGNITLMKENVAVTERIEEKIKNLSSGGNTLAIVANQRAVIGIITLSDEIKEESYAAIQDIHNLGVKVAMLTGDNDGVAKGVADALEIDTYFAQVLPEDKYTHIQNLQKDGSVVLMIGDGVNDAPALTQADAGIAVGAGTDVAVESGDVVLMSNNPQDVRRLIVLSKKVYSKMVQNLVWALGYNVVAIPAAAGAFAAWGFFLRPEVAALLMALSTVIVVANAMLLKRINLQ
tara:strand:- start:12357 stop:14417 length:2061 start_codon:yes stop_codon:yes gene_type:complete